MKKLAKILSIAALCAFTAFAVGCGGDKKAEKKARHQAKRAAKKAQKKAEESTINAEALAVAL